MLRKTDPDSESTPPGNVSLNSEDVLSLVRVLSPVPLPKAGLHSAKKYAAADAAIDGVISKVAVKLLPELQRHLDTLEGKNFGREANAELARNLNRILKRFSCDIVCPKCGECTTAIRYVYMRPGGNWSWRFEHTPSRRHGNTVSIPPLKLQIRSPGRM
jgi:hypothetical protein